MAVIPETISYSEAAARWNCDRFTIRQAIERGEITAYKPGKRVHINREEGDKWFLESGERLKKCNSKRRK